MSQSEEQFDVAVVGGGPAGASAAHALVSRGVNVVIIEKANLPRYKTCGGGLLPTALKLLNADLKAVVECECHTAQFMLSDRLRFRVSRADPIVTMTMRDKLDHLLVDRAVAAGAKLRTNCEVFDLTTNEQHVCLATTQGKIRAGFVIAADGASSTIAKKSGWPLHARVAVALEYEVRVSPSDFERLSSVARFDFHVVSQGYAWVFPKASHLSIGVLTLLRSGVNLRECIEKYLQTLGISQPISIERHGFVIPLAPRKILASNRILLTGDAAGLADPITAEGIRNAIQSAQLAAEAICGGGQVCANYQTAIEREILPELKWARRLAKLLYEMPRARDFVFKLHGQKLTDAMTKIVMGEMSYCQLMSRPLNYLKLFR